jgi:hypothetical protein
MAFVFGVWCRLAVRYLISCMQKKRYQNLPHGLLLYSTLLSLPKHAFPSPGRTNVACRLTAAATLLLLLRSCQVTRVDVSGRCWRRAWWVASYRNGAQVLGNDDETHDGVSSSRFGARVGRLVMLRMLKSE